MPADDFEAQRSGAEEGALGASEAARHTARLDALVAELDGARDGSAPPETNEGLRPRDDFLILVREAHR